MAITYDPSAVVRNLQSFEDLATGAIRRALTRSVNSGSVAMAREIATDIRLKVAVVKEQLRTEVVDSEAGYPVGRLSISGARLPLIDFGATGPGGSSKTRVVLTRGRGRSVTANTGHGRQTYPGAFITAVGSGGHIGVFKRIGASVRKSPGAWSPNLPIVELKGPSLPQVFSKKTDVAIQRFQEQYPKELQREVSFALKKAASS